LFLLHNDMRSVTVIQ